MERLGPFSYLSVQMALLMELMKETRDNGINQKDDRKDERNESTALVVSPWNR